MAMADARQQLLAMQEERAAHALQASICSKHLRAYRQLTLSSRLLSLQVAELAQARDEAEIESDILRQALTQANADLNEAQEAIAAYQADCRRWTDQLYARDQRRAELEARVHEIEASSAAAAARADAAIQQLKMQLKAFICLQREQRQPVNQFDTEAADVTLNSMHLWRNSSNSGDGGGSSTKQQLFQDATLGKRLVCTCHTLSGIC